MAVPETGKSDAPNSPPPRPSWETARPPAHPPRPAAPPLRPQTASAPPRFVSPAPHAADESSWDSSVQYDLAGNPISGSVPPVSASPSAAAPPAPFSYSAGNAAGVWPPPVAGREQATPGNTSGQQGHLPPEIERLRWHWGAFFFPTFWSRRHGLRALALIVVAAFVLLRVLRLAVGPANTAAFIAVCALYAVVHLGIQVYFGMNGHKMGWRNRHFPGGVDQYFQVQKRWMWWGFGVNVLWPILLGIFLATTALSLHSHGANLYTGSHSYSSGGNSGSQLGR